MPGSPLPFPSCFAPGERPSADAVESKSAAARSAVTSVYRTKLAGHCRLITVTWCRDVLARGLSISVDDDDSGGGGRAIGLKVEIRPWYFWRRHGSRRLELDGQAVEVAWDLRGARFGAGEPEPRSGFYVAVAADGEVALLMGDGEREARRRTGCRPAAIVPALVSRREHVVGRSRFSTRARFHDRGRAHEISIEYAAAAAAAAGGDPEMVVKVDGTVAVHVKHLQWKFRGNECITVSRARVEVYWDVHGWLFSPGVSHAIFIFKPTSLLASPSMPLISSSSSSSSPATAGSGFCLFLYAWKLD